MRNRTFAAAPLALGPLALGLLAIVTLSPSLQAAICGTEAGFRARAARSHASGPAAASASITGAARAAASPLPCRTLETAHFLLRYSLRGAHRIKLMDLDADLTRAKDSLYAALASMAAGPARDSAVISGLDRGAAPHPAYASAMADIFEKGHAYYTGTLGMKSPESVGPSIFYRAPSKAGKYAVDIADVYPAAVAAGVRVEEQTYGITLLPSEGGMVMENDFLWGSSLDPTGEFPVGSPLRSCSRQPCTADNVIHDYGVEWLEGLKVTGYHELYHAVQLTYTPDTENYHIWYETGAVAMEERNAPEVDDYLQYLPVYFTTLPVTGMFEYVNLNDYNPRYGNGIFHMFIASKLGADFDADIWTLLAKNGNDIRDALPRILTARGSSPRRIWSEYAAQLAFRGGAMRSRPASLPPFSPDMARWPGPAPASLDLDGAAVLRSGSQRPFTIRDFRITGAANGKALFPKDTLQAAVFASLGADTGSVAFPMGTALALDWPPPTGAERVLLLANASRDKPYEAEIRANSSIASNRPFAYPNPLRLIGGAGRVLFARLPGAATVRIIAENGTLVRELAFDPDSPLWSWDLLDEKERPVLPGLYYFGTGMGALAPLVILR